MKIIIYTSPTCPWCKKAKEHLEKKNVKFEERDVVGNDGYKSEVADKSGQMGVPVIDINGKIIVGFDEDGIDKALSKNNGG